MFEVCRRALKSHEFGVRRLDHYTKAGPRQQEVADLKRTAELNDDTETLRYKSISFEGCPHASLVLVEEVVVRDDVEHKHENRPKNETDPNNKRDADRGKDAKRLAQKQKLKAKHAGTTHQEIHQETNVVSQGIAASAKTGTNRQRPQVNRKAGTTVKDQNAPSVNEGSRPKFGTEEQADGKRALTVDKALQVGDVTDSVKSVAAQKHNIATVRKDLNVKHRDDADKKGPRTIRQGLTMDGKGKLPSSATSSGILRRLELEEEEFFDFLYSERWEEGCLLRVLSGKLLENLLHVLTQLEKFHDVISYATMAYVYNRKLLLPCIKSATSKAEPGSIVERVLVEFDCFCPQERPEEVTRQLPITDSPSQSTSELGSDPSLVCQDSDGKENEQSTSDTQNEQLQTRQDEQKDGQLDSVQDEQKDGQLDSRQDKQEDEQLDSRKDEQGDEDKMSMGPPDGLPTLEFSTRDEIQFAAPTAQDESAASRTADGGETESPQSIPESSTQMVAPARKDPTQDIAALTSPQSNTDGSETQNSVSTPLNQTATSVNEKPDSSNVQPRSILKPGSVAVMDGSSSSDSTSAQPSVRVAEPGIVSFSDVIHSVTLPAARDIVAYLAPVEKLSEPVGAVSVPQQLSRSSAEQAADQDTELSIEDPSESFTKESNACEVADVTDVPTVAETTDDSSDSFPDSSEDSPPRGVQLPAIKCNIRGQTLPPPPHTTCLSSRHMIREPFLKRRCRLQSAFPNIQLPNLPLNLVSGLQLKLADDIMLEDERYLGPKVDDGTEVIASTTSLQKIPRGSSDTVDASQKGVKTEKHTKSIYSQELAKEQSALAKKAKLAKKSKKIQADESSDEDNVLEEIGLQFYLDPIRRKKFITDVDIIDNERVLKPASSMAMKVSMDTRLESAAKDKMLTRQLHPCKAGYRGNLPALLPRQNMPITQQLHPCKGDSRRNVHAIMPAHPTDSDRGPPQSPSHRHIDTPDPPFHFIMKWTKCPDFEDFSKYIEEEKRKPRRSKFKLCMAERKGLGLKRLKDDTSKSKDKSNKERKTASKDKSNKKQETKSKKEQTTASKEKSNKEQETASKDKSKQQQKTASDGKPKKEPQTTLKDKSKKEQETASKDTSEKEQETASKDKSKMAEQKTTSKEGPEKTGVDLLKDDKSKSKDEAKERQKKSKEVHMKIEFDVPEAGKEGHDMEHSKKRESFDHSKKRQGTDTGKERQSTDSKHGEREHSKTSRRQKEDRRESDKPVKKPHHAEASGQQKKMTTKASSSGVKATTHTKEVPSRRSHEPRSTSEGHAMKEPPEKTSNIQGKQISGKKVTEASDDETEPEESPADKQLLSPKELGILHAHTRMQVASKQTKERQAVPVSREQSTHVLVPCLITPNVEMQRMASIGITPSGTHLLDEEQEMVVMEENLIMSSVDPWHVSVHFAYLAGGVCDSVPVRNDLLRRRQKIFRLIKEAKDIIQINEERLLASLKKPDEPELQKQVKLDSPDMDSEEEDSLLFQEKFVLKSKTKGKETGGDEDTASVHQSDDSKKALKGKGKGKGIDVRAQIEKGKTKSRPSDETKGQLGGKQKPTKEDGASKGKLAGKQKQKKEDDDPTRKTRRKHRHKKGDDDSSEETEDEEQRGKTRRKQRHKKDDDDSSEETEDDESKRKTRRKKRHKKEDDDSNEENEQELQTEDDGLIENITDSQIQQEEDNEPSEKVEGKQRNEKTGDESTGEKGGKRQRHSEESGLDDKSKVETRHKKRLSKGDDDSGSCDGSGKKTSGKRRMSGRESREEASRQTDTNQKGSEKELSKHKDDDEEADDKERHMEPGQQKSQDNKVCEHVEDSDIPSDISPEELFKIMRLGERFNNRQLHSAYSFEKLYSHRPGSIENYAKLLSVFEKPFKKIKPKEKDKKIKQKPLESREVKEEVKEMEEPTEEDVEERTEEDMEEEDMEERTEEDVEEPTEEEMKERIEKSPPIVLGRLRDFKFLQHKHHTPAHVKASYHPQKKMSADKFCQKLILAMQKFVVRKERATTTFGTCQFKSKISVTFTKRAPGDTWLGVPPMADSRRMVAAVCQTLQAA